MLFGDTEFCLVRTKFVRELYTANINIALYYLLLLLERLEMSNTYLQSPALLLLFSLTTEMHRIAVSLTDSPIRRHLRPKRHQLAITVSSTSVIHGRWRSQNIEADRLTRFSRSSPEDRIVL